MRISSPSLRVDDGKAKLAVTVSTADGDREMWYSIPAEFASWFATDRCDGFVVGLILQAMKLGEDIDVTGAMSSRLYHSLQGFFVPMVADAFTELTRIRISPSSLVHARLESTGVATGF